MEEKNKSKSKKYFIKKIKKLLKKTNLDEIDVIELQKHNINYNLKKYVNKVYDDVVKITPTTVEVETVLSNKTITTILNLNDLSKKRLKKILKIVEIYIDKL